MVGRGTRVPRRKSAMVTDVTPEETVILAHRSRSYTLPYFMVARAQMILLAAQGLGNDQIAARLSMGRDVVSQWRKRFFLERIAGLEERPRPGRPRAFPPRDRRPGEGSRV